MPFWHRVFKGRRPTDSVRSGVSQPSNAEAPDFIQPNRSASVSSESIQPSQPVTRHTIPNRLDWSVDFSSDVKPALNVKLEHVLIPGAMVERVKFSPDGKYLAVGIMSGRTYIYDVKTGVKSWSVTITGFGDVN